MQSLTTLLDRLGNTLPVDVLDSTLKATVILLIAALAVSALRRSSAAIRHGVLTAALLSTVALPFLSRGLPRFEVPGLTGFLPLAVQVESDEYRAPPEPVFEATDEEHRISSVFVRNAKTTDPGMTSSASPNNAVELRTLTLRRGIASFGLAVWILGALSALLAIALGEIRSICLKRASTEVRNRAWIRSMSEATRQHRLIRRVSLLENETISVPMTCGTIYPSILIPSEFCCSTAERRRILQHEIAHVIRFDVALQTLGRLACAFYWFHPLAWWCLRQMHREREQACDDWVLQAGERPTEYADQLLSLAKGKLRPWPPSAAVGIVRNGNLEKRVHAILSNEYSHEAMGYVRATLLIFFSICFGVTVAIIHPQPLVAAKPEDPQDRSKEEVSEHYVESTSDPTKTDSYTVPINATGLALDANGKPIPSATIYMSSQGVLWDTKRIAETITDDKGRYTLENINLPIRRADTNHGRDHGSFILFGTARGHGFAWRPNKRFYPNPNPGHSYFEDSNRDQPRRFERGDKIELDLTFPEPSTIRGTIVDGDGKPIAKTKLSIWNAEEVPHDGYGPRQRGSDRRPFSVFDNDGFELLNADVPPQVWISYTDAEGQFEFSSVPRGRRFRVNVQPPGFPSRMVWFTTQAGMDEEYDEYRLYDASKAIGLSFRNTMDVPIQVVYADTGRPAPNVAVGAFNKSASAFKTTDEEGRVSLAVPPGEYRLSILRAYGTPYLEADGSFTLGDEAPSKAIVAKLPAAGQVEIVVIDKETGKGIKNVDLWRESPETGRVLHYTTVTVPSGAPCEG